MVSFNLQIPFSNELNFICQIFDKDCLRNLFIFRKVTRYQTGILNDEILQNWPLVFGGTRFDRKIRIGPDFLAGTNGDFWRPKNGRR